MKKQPPEWMPVVRNRYRELPDGTVEIELTRGKVCVIDKADFSLVSHRRWWAIKANRDVYFAVAKIQKHGRTRLLYMHKVLCPEAAYDHVNHVDGDTLNDTRRNLRPCTHRESGRAMHKQRKLTSSRFKGVYFNKRERKWRAQIEKDEKNHNLGCFNSEIDAARAYDVAAEKLFGEFARLNFPMKATG